MWAAIGAAAAAIIGGIVSSSGKRKQAGQVRTMNEKQRQFTLDMYKRRKKDNLSMWNRVNLYNTPKAQMARFSEAGLNPNLMYGQASSGNAQSLSSPDAQAWNPDTPDVGAQYEPWSNLVTNAMGQIGQYAGIRQTNAQTSNIEKDSKLKELNTVNAGIQSQSLLLKNKLSKNNVKKSNALLSTQIDFAKQSLKNAQQDQKMKQASTRKILNQAYHESLQAANTKAQKRNIMKQYQIMSKKENILKVELRQKKAGIENSGSLKPLYMLIMNGYRNMTQPTENMVNPTNMMNDLM